MRPRQILEGRHHRRGAERIDEAEGPAEKRRKSDPEDGTDITVPRRANDALRHGAGRFIQQRIDQSSFNLAGVDGRQGLDAEQPVDLGVGIGLLPSW